MNNFGSNYDKILEILKSITKKESFITQIREPKLKDIELIAMNLTSEYMSIDSECQLFRIIPEVLSNKIERSVYNRRKRKLFTSMEFIREKLSERFNEFEDYYIVDSMPLEVAKLSRSGRSTICKESYDTHQIKDFVQVKT